ncbi:MAG: DUF4469 domain-containing protein [Prevotellaceae bacterium]|jgi:hypothetical protein|nr:DUF4469 domain-containing protein [Prevotellaceae bacterium]
MIDYVLENNPLTKENNNDRRARVVNQHSYTENDLADAIVQRNMGISRPEALAMLQAAAEIQLEWIRAGHSVNMQLAHYHPTIPGVYGEGELPKEAVVRVTPSKKVTEAAKKITLRHVEAVNPISIDFVHDVKSDTTNDKVTSGGTVKISGHNVRIAGTEPTVGVRFIDTEDPGIVYDVPKVDIIVNNRSELMVIAPQMVSGKTVTIKITTQYSGSKLLKDPRSTTLNKEITVV